VSGEGEAAKRLTDYIADGARDAMREVVHDGTNDGITREECAAAVSRVLDGVRDAGHVKDYEVGAPHVETWESLFPLMPERLLVLCAYESGELPHSCEDRPDHPLRGYYRYAGFYRLHGVDEEGYSWSEYACSADDGPPDVADDQTVELVERWEFPTPGALMFDLWVTPAKPISYITLSVNVLPGTDDV